MQVVNFEQGSDDWKEYRSGARNGSEASVIMGCSSHCKRTDLVRFKALGTQEEHSDFVVEVIFERGHLIEPVARRFAEEMMAQFMDPVVAVDDEGFLSASLDGLSDDGTTTFECKQWNEGKVSQVRDGIVPQTDYWQCVQGMAVTGAQRCLYVVSDGTEEGTVHTFLDRKEDDIQKLKEAWRIFDEDVKNYEHVDRKQLIANPVAELPDVIIDLNTMVTANNLDEVKEQALQVFRSIKTELATDQDFQDAKVSAKWCRDMCKKLAEAKDRAIKSNYDVNVIMTMIDDLHEESRQTALNLEKQVKSENQRIRADLKRNAERELATFIADLEHDFPPAELQPDFAAAMKNKKTIEGLEEGVSVHLSHLKIAATELNNLMTSNSKRLEEIAGDIIHLFPDRNVLIKKPQEVMEATVVLRIKDFNEREAIRLEREAKREEERKAREAEALKRAAEEAAKAVQALAERNESTARALDTVNVSVIEKNVPASNPYSKETDKPESIKSVILDVISDTVCDFLYYGRKECDSLPVGRIEQAVKDGEISVDCIIDAFKKELLKALKEEK